MRQKIYIGIVNNGIYIPNQSDVITDFKDWIFRKTPFEAEMMMGETTLEITYEKAFANGMEYQIIDRKTRERIVSIFPQNTYQMIFHIHKQPTGGHFGAGMSFRELMNGACVTDILVSNNTTPHEQLRNLSHEFIHNLWTLLYHYGGIPIENDTMDTYYKDDQMEASDGNRETNLRRITQAMWEIIARGGERITIITLLKTAIALAIQLLSKVTGKVAAEEPKIEQLYTIPIMEENKQEETAKSTEEKVDEIINPPKYLWDTRENAKHSVRVICDEEGLKVWEKNLIDAVICAESGYDTKIIRKNVHGNSISYDYGICQLNSYWYIEKGKLVTKWQALNDPEFCVRLIIKRYRKGFLKDWVAYTSGSYKKFLPQSLGGERSQEEIKQKITMDWLTSSEGYGIAIRVRAILVGLIGFIILILRSMNVEIAETELMQWIEAITLLIAVVLYIYGEARRRIFKQYGMGKYRSPKNG